MVATYFQKLVQSNQRPTVADVNTTVQLLGNLARLETALPLGRDLLVPIVAIVSDLLSDRNIPLWPMVNEGGANRLLATVEEIGRLAAESTASEEWVSLETEHFNIFTINEQKFAGVEYTLDSDNSVSVPRELVPAGMYAIYNGGWSCNQSRCITN